MIIKHDLSEQEISDFFINDPRLAYLGLSDKTLTYMYNYNIYEVNKNSKYAGIYDDNNHLVAIFKWELFTDVTITLHLYVSSVLHSTGILYKIKEEMYDFFSKSTSFKKVIVPVPSNCPHVIKACEKLGFIHESTLTDCTMWRQELIDLLFYTMKLKEE